MYVTQATQAGSPDVLPYTQTDAPAPGPGQVLVRTGAIGVNFIDTYHRSGVYPMDFPLVPGLEGAGTVSAVGEGVTTVAEGDRVAWATSASGSYAQQVLVEAAHALPVPDEIDINTAAALPLQGMTAQMLTDGVVSLEPEQNVLLTAGAGGVGLLLTQLATAAGARVITTVSTPEKEELSRQAGASAVIRSDQLGHMTTDMHVNVRELTGGVW